VGDSKPTRPDQVGARAVRRISKIAFLVLVAATAVGLGAFFDNIVGYHLVWGGTVCEDTGVIQSCVGYPPAGIMVLAIVSTLLWTGILQGVSRVVETEVLGL